MGENEVFGDIINYIDISELKKEIEIAENFLKEKENIKLYQKTSLDELKNKVEDIKKTYDSLKKQEDINNKINELKKYLEDFKSDAKNKLNKDDLKKFIDEAIKRRDNGSKYEKAVVDALNEEIKKSESLINNTNPVNQKDIDEQLNSLRKEQINY